MGTTSSISQTFSGAFNLSASLGGEDVKNFATLGAGWSTSTTDSRSITMSNNLSTLNRWTGTSEGINHDQDVLEVWLNPAVELSFTSSNEASWRLMNHPGDPLSATVGANVVHLTVAQLLGKEPITNEHLLARLKREWPGGGALTGPGTDSDFHAIAKQNPYHAIGSDFMGNTFVPDPNRFSLTNLRSVDYSPASGVVHTSSLMVQNEGIETKGNSIVSSYSVSAAMGAGLTKFFGITANKSWTWTDEITTSRTVTNSSHAELSVPQPGNDWRGPTHIAVYTDTLYGSFLFTYLR
ncbi:hypothetical protein [Geothrix sp. 21YS21S-2]|uniref:hypothetical protein n=1 Tax=Geothrix sp. 21YS21S-2 TaxID=3068893 RepID=UPI0027BA464C|nr:hypothetical protein [Geothrix sp. 21YS21S-2]